MEGLKWEGGVGKVTDEAGVDGEGEGEGGARRRGEGGAHEAGDGEEARMR